MKQLGTLHPWKYLLEEEGSAPLVHPMCEPWLHAYGTELT
jgi:hypothetical protein